MCSFSPLPEGERSELGEIDDHDEQDDVLEHEETGRLDLDTVACALGAGLDADIDRTERQHSADQQRRGVERAGIGKTRLIFKAN